jgi:nucleoside-diphosphate-sugar epimerase
VVEVAVPSTPRLLITGAGGFVGRALTAALDARGRPWVAATRRHDPALGRRQVAVGDIDAHTDWDAALAGIDCVIHLAARTHVLREDSANPLAAYRRINVEGTRRLSLAAARAGVGRLVFLSSIKVNGEATTSHPYTETDVPAPEDAYGLSKLEAEQALESVAAGSNMQPVILRPPLVYGPGVKGNLLRLMHALDRGLPLPLASVRNRRSLIYVGNLADAILACIDAPAAAGATFLVSDGEDVSTPELLMRLASGLGRRARLWPCPVAALRAAGHLLGRNAEIARLTGSLQIDASLIRKQLGWQPRYSTNQGLTETAQWYHQRRS